MDKDAIIHLLRTDKRAVARALIVLTARQTDDEQRSENTKYLNGRGFRPCHARMGTSHAKFFQRTGFLTDKQINYWRVPMACGNMRLGIYWAQLLEAAQDKSREKIRASQPEIPFPAVQAAFVAQGVHQLTIGKDLGNDMERKAELEYEKGMVIDSDDEALIAPIQAEIDAIDAFWKKIRPNG